MDVNILAIQKDNWVDPIPKWDKKDDLIFIQEYPNRKPNQCAVDNNCINFLHSNINPNRNFYQSIIDSIGLKSLSIS